MASQHKLRRLAIAGIVAMASTISLAATPAAHAAVQATLYVSPGGAGSSCTQSAPCSLTAARDKARAMTPSMTGDIVVSLASGHYFLSSTFTLDSPADSGTSPHKVIYQAATSGGAILNGGRQITGWQPVAGKPGVYRAPAAGLRTRQFYVNGVRATPARSDWLGSSDFSKTATGWTGLQAPFTSMGSWRNTQDIELWGYTRWRSFRCRVASISGASLAMQNPCWTNAAGAWNSVAYVENAYELLDAPGEYYNDETEGYLYYYPRAGQDLSTALAIAPVRSELLKVAGTATAPLHDITFRGIVFAYATWLGPSGTDGFVETGKNVHLAGAGQTPVMVPGNVSVVHARSLIFDGCSFRRLGGAGLSLGTGSRTIRVLNSTFDDISGTGISIGDLDRAPADDLRTNDIQVQNSIVEHAGQEYQGAAGIFATYASGLVIAHNTVQHLPLDGIMVGWHGPSYYQNNVIAYNKVSDVGNLLFDVGGIHTLNPQPGSVIHHNYVVDTGRAGDPLTAFNALYLDNNSSDLLVEDNVVDTYYDTWMSMWHNNATGNTVRDNYVRKDWVTCARDGQVNQFGASALCDGEHGNTWTNNVVETSGWSSVPQSIIDGAGAGA
ncbi:right-handed parallel beta-helix repeat-containing protein [Nonomuraea sp. MTCD27]|uniref:right-handed parallel beta-helix repeat-containing protein n=1 Tax=Nonomuraea sp. MTCD27 TaxID=1676747 RepID=UPI0035C18D70